MSLPSFPSTSGLKPSELHVYTIEECQSCRQKTKRDFKVGDYIACAIGTCEKCQGQKMIIQIYGEKAAKPPTTGIRMGLGRGPKNTEGGGAKTLFAKAQRLHRYAVLALHSLCLKPGLSASQSRSTDPRLDRLLIG